MPKPENYDEKYIQPWRDRFLEALYDHGPLSTGEILSCFPDIFSGEDWVYARLSEMEGIVYEEDGLWRIV